MNWLAHLLLSKTDVEYQIGNFLADPLKGRPWQGASHAIAQGMKMHTAIDVYTDAHAVVSLSKSRLGKKGYLKGVVIDLLYDHFLSLNWQRYASVSQPVFLDAFYAGASQKLMHYPEKAEHVLTWLIKSDRLARYETFDGFIDALHKLDSRLSPRIKAKDSTLNYIGVVEQNYQRLAEDFDVFFPQLIAFFKQHELGSADDHYLAFCL